MTKLTKKAFREYLNARYPLNDELGAHSGGRHRVNGGPLRGAIKRPYGDYLYAQDREKFNAEYSEWTWEQHHSIDGKLTTCKEAKP